MNSTDSVDIDGIMKSFWEVEELLSIVKSSPEDEACENHFFSTHSMEDTGRYMVCLPFRELTMNQFHSLERRLLKKPEVYTLYVEFMREYLNQNHMSLVPQEEIFDVAYYIPQHCVLKPKSETTKSRVIFNAAAKLPNQKSLNLHRETKFQQDIVTQLSMSCFCPLCRY